jgi:hypothetical protein
VVIKFGGWIIGLYPYSRGVDLILDFSQAPANYLTQAGNLAHGEGRYYLATAVGGVFGAGDGPEYVPGLYPGVYVPRWVAISALSALDVRPWQIARALAAGEFPPEAGVTGFHEHRD